MALCDLVENCCYGDMREEMTCGHHVVGIHSNALSEKLQLDTKLTLETANTTIHQKEAVHEQQQTLKGAESASSLSGNVDAIGNRRKNFAKTLATKRWTNTEKASTSWKEVWSLLQRTSSKG